MKRSEKGNPLDLRAWLDEARKLGEVKDVRGADWNLELGAISELNVKKNAPPALLFDEIAGYPKGFRVLTCSTSSPGKLSSHPAPRSREVAPGSGAEAARFAEDVAGERRRTTIPWSLRKVRSSRMFKAMEKWTCSLFHLLSGTRRTAGATSAPAAAW